MTEDVRSTSAAKNELDREKMQLTIEALCRVAAWFALPTRLPLRKGPASDFPLYALSAGSLGSAGFAAHRWQASEQLKDVIWFATVSCAAVLAVGGAVFGLSRPLQIQHRKLYTND